MSGVSEGRYCSNCRAELPEGAVVCPVCGVYAGDVFDGKLPKQKRSFGIWVVIAGVLALIAAAALFVDQPRSAHKPLRAPVAKSLAGRAGAMQAVRQRLVSDQVPNECLAMMSKGMRDGAYIVDATDRCRHRTLGEWKVDAKTHAVTRAK
jgi:hypothetical protein